MFITARTSFKGQGQKVIYRLKTIPWRNFFHVIRRNIVWNKFFSFNQCDQKKSPNVYKSGLKMISLEKW